MNATVPAEQTRINPAVRFKAQFDERRADFAGALPAHIPFERFARVIQTAVAQNPTLLSADRASLFTSAMKSATDGLLCDGREAALVIYRTKKKDENGERWIEAVQYMPMLAGILKKCRNSGELSSIVARVVYAGDKFRNWIDDTGEHLEYEAGDAQDRSIVRCAFAMAKLKDGSIEVEVLSPVDIEKIRAVSRAKDRGPWVDWWEEMAKKSAIRRLSKRLPLNTDLDDLIRRDDDLYDLKGASDGRARLPRGAVTLDQRLDMLAAPSRAVADDEGTEQDANSAAAPPTGERNSASEQVSASARASAGSSPVSGDPAPDHDADGVIHHDPASLAETRSEPARGHSAPATRYGDAKGVDPSPRGAQRDDAPAKPAPHAAPPRAVETRGSKVGDDPDRDQATLGDLREEGERRAAEGSGALTEFEEGLTEYEMDLIAPFVGPLRRKAKAAGKQALS